MKKLPKKYPVFFVGSLTRIAENRVCKNVERTGKVILVQKSKQTILGMAVKASRENDSKCDTASDITFFSNFVSASVNSNSSPVTFL